MSCLLVNVHQSTPYHVPVTIVKIFIQRMSKSNAFWYTYYGIEKPKRNTMFKLLWRIICTGIITLLAFLILSLKSGGEKFRWFGMEVQKHSEKIGEIADEIRTKGKWISKGLEKSKRKIREVTGGKDERSH